MTTSFSNKLVAVMNEKIEPGIIMNSLAHMCIGFGSEIGKEPNKPKRESSFIMGLFCLEIGIRSLSLLKNFRCGNKTEQND